MDKGSNNFHPAEEYNLLEKRHVIETNDTISVLKVSRKGLDYVPN